MCSGHGMDCINVSAPLEKTQTPLIEHLLLIVYWTSTVKKLLIFCLEFEKNTFTLVFFFSFLPPLDKTRQTLILTERGEEQVAVNYTYILQPSWLSASSFDRLLWTSSHGLVHAWPHAGSFRGHLGDRLQRGVHLHPLPPRVGQVSGLTPGSFLSPLTSALPFHSTPPPSTVCGPSVRDVSGTFRSV